MKPSAEDRCAACGARVPGGEAGCHALWDSLAAQSLSDLRLAALRDLAFDSYCMQHLERYCRSAKSYLAHLARLCCGMEWGGDPSVYAAIQRSLNGTIAASKPERLPFLGAMTVADLAPADGHVPEPEQVRAWAASVWAAYAPQHEIARRWIQGALEQGR